MKLLNLDDVRRRHRRYLVVPALLAIASAFLFQLLFVLFPAFFLFSAALVSFASPGDSLDVVAIMGILFLQVAALSVAGMTFLISYRHFWRRGLWLATLALLAAFATGVAGFAPTFSGVVVACLGLASLLAALIVPFGRMMADADRHPGARLLSQACQRNKLGALARLSPSPLLLVVRVFLLATRLLLLTALYLLAGGAHTAATFLLAPIGGIASAALLMGVFRPCFATAFANGIRKFRARMARTAANLYHRDQRPAVLFLRSFRDDDLKVPHAISGWQKVWGVRRKTIALEEAIAEPAFRFGPVGAVHDPANPLRPLGAARELLSHGNWQAYVADQIRKAGWILMIHAATPGVRWEWSEVLRSGSGHKLILVFPPGSIGADGKAADPSAFAGQTMVPVRTASRDFVLANTHLRPICLVNSDHDEPILIASSTATAEDYERGVLIAMQHLAEGTGHRTSDNAVR